MFTSSTQIRIHYALTDQMGVVYYGNYAQLFEIARTEAIRALGFTYRELEAMGIMMPVSDMHIHYRRPLLYDDLATVEVSIREWPAGRKVVFHGEIRNEQGEVCTTSTITLYFVDAVSRKPVHMPPALESVLRPFFPDTAG
jgi:acyl-CoA thioester hydrolase